MNAARYKKWERHCRATGLGKMIQPNGWSLEQKEQTTSSLRSFFIQTSDDPGFHEKVPPIMQVCGVELSLAPGLITSLRIKFRLSCWWLGILASYHCKYGGWIRWAITSGYSFILDTVCHMLKKFPSSFSLTHWVDQVIFVNLVHTELEA